ncbi:MAG TPA: hypothetical protein DCE39_19245 [Planctomycetaceae bacterium]|nr:hypothetical protein [Planctomycetaceae bacterium]|tara:strand:- start:16017 stop:16451 length:435 start_codon:yes stop_codon:yes gene_type:complete
MAVIGPGGFVEIDGAPCPGGRGAGHDADTTAVACREAIQKGDIEDSPLWRHRQLGRGLDDLVHLGGVGLSAIPVRVDRNQRQRGGPGVTILRGRDAQRNCGRSPVDGERGDDEDKLAVRVWRYSETGEAVSNRDRGGRDPRGAR